MVGTLDCLSGSVFLSCGGSPSLFHDWTELMIFKTFYIIDFFGRTFSADRKKLYLRVCVSCIVMCVLSSVSWKMSGVYNTLLQFLHFLFFQSIFLVLSASWTSAEGLLPNGIAGYLNMGETKCG